MHCWVYNPKMYYEIDRYKNEAEKEVSEGGGSRMK